MGKRGPQPTPTAIKAMRGSSRAKYDNPKEPKPARVSRPKPPAHMSDKAKAGWNGLVKILDATKVLTVADLRIVERYLETWSIWRDAVDYVAANGQTFEVKKAVEGEDGSETLEVVGVKEYPQVRIIARYAVLLVAMERELGLTPAARTRIQVESKPKRGVGRPPGSKKDREIEEETKVDAPRLRVVGGLGA